MLVSPSLVTYEGPLRCSVSISRTCQIDNVLQYQCSILKTQSNVVRNCNLYCFFSEVARICQNHTILHVYVNVMTIYLCTFSLKLFCVRYPLIIKIVAEALLLWITVTILTWQVSDQSGNKSLLIPKGTYPKGDYLSEKGK